MSARTPTTAVRGDVRSPQRRPETRAAERGRAAVGPVVLIADDDAVARRGVEDLLARLGYVTLAAASGDAALLLARSVRPAVVLSELWLAAGGRPCLVDALRHDARLRHVPLVAHSAFTLPADATGGECAPVDAFLRKPAPPAEIVAVVARLAGPPFRARDAHGRHAYGRDARP